MSIKLGFMLACMFACVSGVQASTSVDKSFTAASDDCNSVQWSQEALHKYPTIASACQSVQERNGLRFVKFEGTVESNQKQGRELTVDFKDGGKVALTPPAETNIYIDGKLTPVANLRRGDKLSFYISEDRLAAQLPQEPEVTLTHFVVVPLMAAAPAPVEHESMTASLPHTASDLPMFALGGVLALMLAGGMSLLRVMR
jgi:hypothetical protein